MRAFILRVSRYVVLVCNLIGACVSLCLDYLGINRLVHSIFVLILLYVYINVLYV